MAQVSDRQTAAAVQYRMAYIWAISLVAAMGGLLFGYDWVVIGGAKLFFEKYFNLTTPGAIAWANSCALIGCLVGALVSGALSDKFGRKRLLLLAALLFTITSVGTAMANTFPAFVAWRLLGGVAIGLASNLSPMYIAEVSPAHIRGMFVSINQLTIVIGIVAAQLINYLVAESVAAGVTAQNLDPASWNVQLGWRWMFGLTAIPSFLFLVFTFFVPESPRWLAKNGKSQKAREVLSRIGGPAYASTAIAEIEATLVNETEKVNFRDLLEPKMVKILFIGVVLAVFQQWCGINVLFSYAQEVFEAAGYGVDGVLLNILATGVVCLVFTFVAIFSVDRIGRRILMLIGAGGLAGMYLLIATSFLIASHVHADALKSETPHGILAAVSSGGVILGLVLAAMACYAFTLAPITWVILSEIFPNRIRGGAMAVSVFALWVGCFTLTYTFPHMKDALGIGNTFWVYSAICMAGFVFILRRLPETKGKSLEQIERELVD